MKRPECLTGVLLLGVLTAAYAEKPQSAATKRQTYFISQNELYTRFRYKPITGLGYEEGVNRRDPSSIIEPGSWDSAAVHDPGIIPRWGKYWLYYKGHGIDDLIFADSRWGVAVADQPEGPYVKSELNPVTNSGHEVWVWPWKNGIAAIVDWAGPERDTVQYTEDGVNFEVKCVLDDIPPAGGAYIADKFDDPEDGKGFSWGVCHYGRSDWNFLVRFECDLEQGMEKRLGFQYFPHYSAIRDVMKDPDKFDVPREALDRRAKKPRE